jgi:DNA-binding Xre family transcriptional regulator
MRTAMKVLIEVDIPDLGAALKEARKAKGLSPTNAANAVAMSTANLHRIENESAKGVPLPTLKKLCESLDLDLTDRILDVVRSAVEGE